MVNTSGLARCPFALGSIRFCPFSFALSHFFPSLLFLLLYPWKSLHFSAKTDYLPIVVLRLCHVCLHNERVCACVCTSVRMQQRSRQVNITVGTKQRELVRADVKWPTFLADSELDSFYTFCSPSLVPPFNPTYPPFLFLPYSSPNFLPRLFLPFTLPLLVSLVLVAVCQTRKATRFTRRFSRGIQNENKSNNQKGRVVSRLVKVCREENQRTLMREVIDCSFLSLFFL